MLTTNGEVEVALDTVVTGKPVPPRASVRQRVSAADAERHALALWPDVETEPLGEWVLRTDPAPVDRLVKRANSALALGEPGRPLPEAAQAVRDFYAARDRTPMVQVEADSDTDRGLAALGWHVVAGSDSHFQTASAATALRACGRDLAPTELTEDGPRAEVRTHDSLARGLAALSDEWLGIHAVELDPHARRRGLATAVMADLIDWGASRGARTVWLHVETDNAAALALYERLGFRTHHSLRYRTAG